MTVTHSSDRRVALKEAAHWYSTLCAGEAAERSAGELEAWLAQDPLHRWAWGPRAMACRCPALRGTGRSFSSPCRE